MKLLDAKKNKKYKIIKIEVSDESTLCRFSQLGFIPGENIFLKRKAPLFGDPLLFAVGESQVALTKSEALLVEIEEFQGPKTCNQ